MDVNPWTHDVYVLRRKVFRLFGGAFHIFDPGGGIAFFSEQRAFKLREDIRLYTDETKSVELLTIAAREWIDFSAAYDVLDTVDNIKVGALRRKGFSSMFRDAWEILDEHDHPIGHVREDNLMLALVRRNVFKFLPQTFHADVGEQRVATFKQHFNPFIQKITLDFAVDQQNVLDRRLGIATAVLLCAIEGRQD